MYFLTGGLVSILKPPETPEKTDNVFIRYQVLTLTWVFSLVQGCSGTWGLEIFRGLSEQSMKVCPLSMVAEKVVRLITNTSLYSVYSPVA